MKTKALLSVLVAVIMVCGFLVLTATALKAQPTPLPPSSVSSTDAQNVELVGHIGGPAYAVAAQGNYAYVGTGYEFAVLDVSDPTAPRRVGYTLLPSTIERIVVSGTQFSAAYDQYVSNNWPE